MKKRFLSLALIGAMTASLLAGCGGDTAQKSGGGSQAKAGAEADAPDASGDQTYMIITKSAGNPYNEKEAEGFKEVIEMAGHKCIVQHPEVATAEAQITLIQSAISQGVDAICIAANDQNALQAALEEAMEKGIKVSALDSACNPDSRMTFANQAGVTEIGKALVDAVYDLAGGEGQWAIVSATSQATNQNAWIDAMKEIIEGDQKYAKLELVDVAYGDDEAQKSTDVTQALLTDYPDLKVICAPTTVGIAAAAKVIQDKKSACKLTGLGLPSEMAEYIGDDAEHSCPYMFLWNPIDVGRLGAYISMALVSGDITGAKGETFTAGDMENSPYTITEAGDGGTEVILGPPFKFDPSNIGEWSSVY